MLASPDMGQKQSELKLCKEIGADPGKFNAHEFMKIRSILQQVWNLQQFFLNKPFTPESITIIVRKYVQSSSN